MFDRDVVAGDDDTFQEKAHEPLAAGEVEVREARAQGGGEGGEILPQTIAPRAIHLPCRQFLRAGARRRTRGVEPVAPRLELLDLECAALVFVALNQEFVTGPLTPAQYPGAIASTLGVPLAVVPLFVAQYPLANYPSPSIALGALGTDGIFACNARLSAQRLSAHVPTFEYEFNDADAPQLFLPPVSFPYGAYHAAELQYLFGLTAEVPAPALNAAQEQLSDNMLRSWIQFARSGDPNSLGTPFWPGYQTATDQIQSLVPPTPQIETGFGADHKCDFWASLGG